MLGMLGNAGKETLYVLVLEHLCLLKQPKRGNVFF